VGLVGGGERALEERIGVIEEGIGRAGGGDEGGLTLFETFGQLVVGGEEVDCGGDGGVVGGYGVDEGVEAGFDAVELGLEGCVHDACLGGGGSLSCVDTARFDVW